MGLSQEQIYMLVVMRNKKYEGDLSDPVQKALYDNNLTNAFLDAEEIRMKKQGLIK